MYLNNDGKELIVPWARTNSAQKPQQSLSGHNPARQENKRSQRVAPNLACNYFKLLQTCIVKHVRMRKDSAEPLCSALADHVSWDTTCNSLCTNNCQIAINKHIVVPVLLTACRLPHRDFTALPATSGLTADMVHEFAACVHAKHKR